MINRKTVLIQVSCLLKWALGVNWTNDLWSINICVSKKHALKQDNRCERASDANTLLWNWLIKQYLHTYLPKSCVTFIFNQTRSLNVENLIDRFNNVNGKLTKDWNFAKRFQLCVIKAIACSWPTWLMPV